MKTLRVGLAQINTTVGALKANAEKIKEHITRAYEAGCHIVVFPELAITGYPPEDLLLKPQFIEDNLAALRDVADHTPDIVAIVGFVDRTRDIHNAAAVIHNGKVVDLYHKNFLPNYGVFDERRYFAEGRRAPLYKLHTEKGEVLFGINICEDIWFPEGPHRKQALSGAELLININSSPYHRGKYQERERMLCTRAFDSHAVLVYLNSVGGQDELVFDGASMVVSEKGSLVFRAEQFKESFYVVDLDLEAVFMQRLHDPKTRVFLTEPPEELIEIYLGPRKDTDLEPSASAEVLEEEEEIYSALLLGTRDYVQKNGFSHVLVGLSGGIDSSLVATIATDALGPERVVGVLMPSEFTSKESIEDAEALARALSIKTYTIPITEIFHAYLNTLKVVFKDLPFDVTEENIQARIRGNILMALSNKFGYLVLTTGNKSEMSVGYATLYGDMAGGFAVIKDVPKTMVYKLARWRNQRAPVIPERVLKKPPSAELRPNQKDTDSLPPYEALDPILQAYIEEDKSFEEILELTCDRACVEKVLKMIDRSEYKRRQAPPGIKITERAFGKDRRFPITNHY
ncbi:MAG: NAD+ synthase, partial [Nitrospirae bacterium]